MRKIAGERKVRAPATWSFGLASAALGVVLLLMYGCGSSGRPADLGTDLNYVSTAQGSPCPSAGASRQCGIELGTQNGIVNCTKGTTTCGANGAWGPCIADSVNAMSYSVNAPAPRSAPTGDFIGIRSVGGSAASCSDNPCDPTCQRFDDKPDAPYTNPGNVVVVGVTGPPLALSNVPSGFQSKGSLNNQCASPCNTMLCEEACQFDQHCVTGACTAFAVSEADSCSGSGVDITAPTTCVYPDGSIGISVCNRGNVQAPFGIKCYDFPGGSPKYPDASPSLSHATLVMTTKNPIDPGKCESQDIPASALPNGGIESMMCNPPGSQVGGVGTPSAPVGPNYPSANTSTGWTNPQNGYASDSQYATSALNATNVGPRYPGALANNSGWSGVSGALNADDGVFESVSPPIAGGTQSDYPSAFASNVGWTNPQNAYADDAIYATASPSAPGLGAQTTTAATFPTTYTTTPCSPSTDACTFSNPANAYAGPNGVYAQATVDTGDTATIYYGGFNFSAIPSNAIINGFTINVTWANYAKINTTSNVQAYSASGTAIGTPIFVTNTSSGMVTASQASAFSPGVVTQADLVGTKFIRITAIHDHTSNPTWMNVDDINVTVTYQIANGTTTSSVMLKGFNFDSLIPSGATITGLTTNVEAHVSAPNSNVTFSFQPYKGPSQTTAVGTAYSVAATSPTLTTSDQILTKTNSAATIATLVPSDFNNANFGVQLSVSRAFNGSDIGTFTIYVDYVQVTVTYTYGTTTDTVTLTNFGINIPSGATILDVKTSVEWFVSATNTNVILGVQPYTGNGATTIGGQIANAAGTTPPIVKTTQSVDANTQGSGASIAPADLADGNFVVKLWALRSPGSTNPDITANVDFVSVQVAYISPNSSSVTYSNFGYSETNLPSLRDLSQVTVSVKWRVSASNTNATLSFQAYKDMGVTPIGSATTTTVGTSPPTADTIVSTNLDLTSLSASDLYDGNFFVTVTGTRGNASLPNTDFTAYVDYVSVTATYMTTTGGQLGECNIYNNWSATKLNPPDACQNVTAGGIPPTTVTRVFSGTNCPSGTRIQWNLFGYSTTDPGNSQVQFRFRTFSPSGSPASCVALAPATANPPTPVIVAESTPNSTQVCAINSAQTASCPVNLFTGLGGLPAARLPCLQMDATLAPSSDDTLAPSLNSWDLSYDCVTSE